MGIHSTAIVDKRAEVDPSATIGAYAIVDGPVRIGRDVKVYPNAYLTGWTQIADECQIHPFAVIGHLPQDVAFSGERSYCRIGEGTIVREGATVHRATRPDGTTSVGARCFLMANSHVGHDCFVADDVQFVNGSLLAGHVRVGHGAVFGGNAGVHQFARVGALVMVAGQARLNRDVPPFMLVGSQGEVLGPNTIGIRRAGFDSRQRDEIRRVYRALFRSRRPFSDCLEKVESTVETDAGRQIVAFLRAPSRLGLARGPKSLGADEAA